MNGQVPLTTKVASVHALFMKKEDLVTYIDQHADELFGIAQTIYENPEISKEEVHSAEYFRKLLQENGFTIHNFEQEELKNAFYAEFGTGHPVVAMLGEYDALPGLSQVGGPKRRKQSKMERLDMPVGIICSGPVRLALQSRPKNI